MLRSRTLAACAAAVAALAAATAPAAQAAPASTAYALSNGKIMSFDPQDPATTAQTVSIDGLDAGERLVAVAFRPQNGVLYGLGVDAAADTATLYSIGHDGNSADRPWAAVALGAVGSVALTTDGTTPVDLPAAGYALSFNPAVDRARVTTTTGLNFRIDPNTGAPIDGNDGGSVTTGVNPDGALHGVSSSAGGLGYTNPEINATATTAYTLDAASDALAILNPPNAGNQTDALPLTEDGAPFDATSVSGFAMDPAAYSDLPNAPAGFGWAYAAFKLGAKTKLYAIELVSGDVTEIGTIGDGTKPIQSLALPRDASADGYPAIGLDADGSGTLRRFESFTPWIQTTLSAGGRAAGEQLVGLAWRPQTGQLIGAGINATNNTGTVYRIDPQTGAATAIGATGSLAWVDGGGTPVDLPASGWGVDVQPEYDTLRLITASGLNLRASLTTGAPIDGDLGATAGSVPGTNPDHGLTGEPAGATGPTSITYAYPWPTVPLSSFDVAFALEPGANKVLLSVGTEFGQFDHNSEKAVTLGDAALDFGPVTATDIPLGKGAVRQSGLMISALVVGGTPGLYGINPDTGSAESYGTLPAALSALAVGAAEPRPPAAPIADPPPPAHHDDDVDTKPNTAPQTNTVPSVVQPTPPSPAPPADRLAPTIKHLKISARAKRRLTVTFTASEAGRATITLIRETRHGRHTVRKTYKSVARTVTKPGRVTVTFNRLPAGAHLRIEIKMKDNAGNAARTVARTATVRRR